MSGHHTSPPVSIVDPANVGPASAGCDAANGCKPPEGGPTGWAGVGPASVGPALAGLGRATTEGFTAVCPLDQIPLLGARVIERPECAGGNVAVFRTADDRVFALVDRCPHQGGPLSQGIVHGDRVACPLHGWNIELASGTAVAPDEGCAGGFPVRVEHGHVFVRLSLGPNVR